MGIKHLFPENNRSFSGNNKVFEKNNKVFEKNNKVFEKKNRSFFEKNKTFSENNKVFLNEQLFLGFSQMFHDDGHFVFQKTVAVFVVAGLIQFLLQRHIPLHPAIQGLQGCRGGSSGAV